MTGLLWLWLPLVGCSGEDDDVRPPKKVVPTETGVHSTADTGDVVVDTCLDTPATWENVAEPFLLTWCTPCHSSEIVGISRQGAPAGLDFNTWELAAPFAALILAAATPESPRMPPEGSANADERAWLAKWVECGALGPATPIGPCDDLRAAPPGTADPCAMGFNTVAGDLSPVQGTDLDCLCSVEGDLNLSALPDATMPLLQSVGGSLSATNAGLTTLVAPALSEIGDHLQLVDLAALSTLDLGNLRTVGRDVLLIRLGALPTLELPQLTDVGESLFAEQLPLTTRLWLERVETVGADYRVADNPLLEDAPFWYELESIGGDLVLRNNPGIGELLFATYLTELGGSVEVGGNGITSLAMLHDLVEVPGDIYIHDEPFLTELVGLEDATTVGGALRLHRLPLLESAKLLPAALTLGGIDLEGLTVLQTGPAGTTSGIAGPVRYVDNPVMRGLPWLGGSRIVAGSLQLIDLPGLNTAAPMAVLQEIEGPLLVTRVGLPDANWPLLEKALSITLDDLPNATRVRFARLEKVYGSVEMSHLATASVIAMNHADVEIQGTLMVDDADNLTTLTGLYTVGRLTGDLVITNNVLLPSTEVDALAVEIPFLLGVVVNSGNDG